MTGKYLIEIYDNHIAYRLEVKRNITIIQGNSGTGKTELIRLISDYNRGGASSGITLICERECVALNVLDWETYLKNAHEKIIFIDENSAFIRSKEFAEIVKTSDNYFVLVYRDSLPQLSYSVEEIYGMRESRESQKYVPVRRVYNELYKLYNVKDLSPICPDVVVTEDTNSGFEFFREIFPQKCMSAGGKSRVSQVVSGVAGESGEVLAIVDGAAFGADIQQFIRKSRNTSAHCVLYAPESFEYLLLISGIVQTREDVLENTFDYADSCKYASWERYYTSYLTEITEGTIYHYQKSHLNPNYLTEGNLEKIKRVLPPLIRTN